MEAVESPPGVTMASALLPIEEFPRETDRENVQIIVQSDMLTESVASDELFAVNLFWDKNPLGTGLPLEFAVAN